jgi:hypothetical protein
MRRQGRAFAMAFSDKSLPRTSSGAGFGRSEPLLVFAHDLVRKVSQLFAIMRYGE